MWSMRWLGQCRVLHVERDVDTHLGGALGDAVERAVAHARGRPRVLQVADVLTHVVEAREAAGRGQAPGGMEAVLEVLARDEPEREATGDPVAGDDPLQPAVLRGLDEQGTHHGDTSCLEPFPGGVHAHRPGTSRLPHLRRLLLLGLGARGSVAADPGPLGHLAHVLAEDDRGDGRATTPGTISYMPTMPVRRRCRGSARRGPTSSAPPTQGLSNVWIGVMKMRWCRLIVGDRGRRDPATPLQTVRVAGIRYTRSLQASANVGATGGGPGARPRGSGRRGTSRPGKGSTRTRRAALGA